MLYRAVKANENNDIIAIGRDEQQGGVDYNGIGVWCDFTFEAIPTIPTDIQSIITAKLGNDSSPNLLCVKDGTIAVKTAEEVTAQINAYIAENPKRAARTSSPEPTPTSEDETPVEDEGNDTPIEE